MKVRNLPYPFLRGQPLKTLGFPRTIACYYMSPALSRWGFSTFSWLYVNVLTENVLISRSLFDIVEPEVSFRH